MARGCEAWAVGSWRGLQAILFLQNHRKQTKRFIYTRPRLVRRAPLTLPFFLHELVPTMHSLTPRKNQLNPPTRACSSIHACMHPLDSFHASNSTRLTHPSIPRRRKTRWNFSQPARCMGRASACVGVAEGRSRWACARGLVARHALLLLLLLHHTTHTHPSRPQERLRPGICSALLLGWMLPLLIR